MFAMYSMNCTSKMCNVMLINLGVNYVYYALLVGPTYLKSFAC
jgi:hypothetical protein